MARPARSDPFEARLRAIYSEADALFAGWSCPGLARCCQFGVTGRQPELWPVEWRVLERALPAGPSAADMMANAAFALGLVERGETAHHERLVTKADAHLYAAKNGGRNRVVAG